MKVYVGEESKPHEIKALTGKAFIDLMKVINSLMKEAKENTELKGLLTQLFEDESGQEKDIKDVELSDVTSKVIDNAVGSFETIFIMVPEKAFELLAALSGLSADDLQNEDIENIMNIFDAVVEVNDIEKLVNRLKKSLEKTKARMTFLQARRKATNSPVAETISQ